MTPAARVAAAIEIIDDILTGVVPEKALTGWGRSHRFAGSKDRAAIRDHVFGALRCKASFAWLGGAMTGRGIMLGAMRDAGLEVEMFTGEGHAPEPVVSGEEGADLTSAPRDVRFDMPNWMLTRFDDALGAEADTVMGLLRSRAGVFLRVNEARATPAEAIASLAEDGIVCTLIHDVKNALHVIENERRVAQSTAYMSGWVELQDTSSQTAMLALDISEGDRVLDYCAGGGGKALALAARGAQVTAHDIDPRRMMDIAPRADRAGVTIATATHDQLVTEKPFDLVLCDAPCSGSGTWRRAPAAKWDFTPERLAELNHIQDDVLRKAAPLVRAGGVLAYATCSVFRAENQDRVQAFIQTHPDFEIRSELSLQPHELGDGFLLTVMRRAD